MHALDCELRLYDKLFSVPNPDDVPEGADFTSVLNPDSLVVVRGAKIEPSVGQGGTGARYQFERTGYFAADPDSREGMLVFNRTVTLKDTWAKLHPSPRP
jgi:glutaminyl-tRNA synthetase